MRTRCRRMAMAAGASALLLSAIVSQGAEQSRLIANLEAGRKQTVVAYGTSLTEGGAWVRQLSDALDGRYPGLATVINSGQYGVCSQWGVDHLQERVLAKQPDTVLVEFAVNDAYAPYRVSVEQARSNLVAMIDRIQATNSRCEILLMVMNPATGVPLSQRPRLESYNRMYRNVAARRQLPLIDHDPNWRQILRDNPTAFARYIPDGIHPNAEGCRVVITPAILGALGMADDAAEFQRRGCVGSPAAAGHVPAGADQRSP